MTQTLNQFYQSPEKGDLDLGFNQFTVSAVVYGSEATALVAGQAVKLVAGTTKGLPVVTAVTGITDTVFGFVNRSLKDIDFPAKSRCEVSLKGNVMYMLSHAAVTQGAALQLELSGNEVMNQTASNTIIGWAYDGAAGAGELIRVFIEAPVQLWQAPGNIALASTHIIVGNGAGTGADVALSGDATMANTGAITVNKLKGKTVYSGLSVSESDADATVTIACAGLVAGDVAVATLKAAANAVYVTKAVCGTDEIVVTLSGNGGAGTVISYFALKV
jgi:hypothetical protein